MINHEEFYRQYQAQTYPEWAAEKKVTKYKKMDFYVKAAIALSLAPISFYFFLALVKALLGAAQD